MAGRGGCGRPGLFNKLAIAEDERGVVAADGTDWQRREQSAPAQKRGMNTLRVTNG